MNALVQLPQPGEAVSLTQYERMREAVAIATSADEAKAWIDRAAAAAFYARQIRDREVETWLTEIKRRAEYRLGEMLLAVEPQKGGRRAAEAGSGAWSNSIRSIVASLGMERSTAQALMTFAGPRDESLQAIGRAAAEAYYAQARQHQQPATREATIAHVKAAVQDAVGPAGIRRAYKDLVRQDLAVKAGRRAEREVRLGERSRRASERLGTTLFPVIYADPPWDYEVWSAETGKGRAAANHYPTMPLGQICALPVPAAPNAVLFLWVPANLVPAGCQVVDSWRFTFKTQIVWRKPHAGTGLWFRSRHENLFVATRGYDVPAPALGQQPESVIDAALEARRHSAKPVAFHDLIAGLYPTAPKLELFARERRPGWEAWGNEVDDDSDGEGSAPFARAPAGRALAGTA